MKNTLIEWCHHTVNFWWGCTFARLLDGSVRQECIHCYALKLSKFFSRGRATWGEQGRRWVRHEAARRELYRMDKLAFRRGVRERVFINSMSDTFEDRRDLDEARSMLWGACQFVTNIDMLLLTKRPENVARMVPPSWLENWPAHVWIGTTAGTQQAADEAIPHLLKIPAKVRFLSCEPLLGPVNLTLPASVMVGGYNSLKPYRPEGCTTPEQPRVHWVICGGESGPGARPMHPDWARSLRDQCAAAGVPFFFKQWGEWFPAEQYTAAHANLREKAQHTFDADTHSFWVGKLAAGRLLDGKEHSAWPTP